MTGSPWPGPVALLQTGRLPSQSTQKDKRLSYTHLVDDPIDWPCHWCGRRMTAPGIEELSATRDHLHPKIVRLDVNTKKINRQVWSCRACNEVKGDLRLVNWKVFMAAHPQWWTLWRSGYFSGRKRLQNQQKNMKKGNQYET